MIKQEFKKIFDNKLLLATVIVVAILPLLYAGVFLKSVWDPYGNMDKLPVAVVNEDKTVQFQGKTLDVGDQVVSNLKENNDLDWNFVSKKEAQDGLKDRKYYMVVTIPENFSENASTVLDPDPEKLDLKYETNAGVNFIGEVVGDTAMKELKSQVGENVTKSYAQAILSNIKKVGGGMTQAANGAKKLDDGANKINDGVGQLSEKVPTLANGVTKLDEGSTKLESGVGQYTDGVSQLNGGINKLAGKVPALTGGISQLDDGSTRLYAGVVPYTNGVDTIASKMPELTNGVNKLESGANKVNGGVTQYTDGVNQLAGGINTLSGKIPTLSKGATDLNTGASDLSKGLNDLNNKLNAPLEDGGLVAGITSLNAGMNKLNSSLNDGSLQKLQTYVNGTNTLIKTLAGLDTSSLQGLGALKGNLETMATNLQSAKGLLEEAKSAATPQAEDKSGEVISALASTNEGKGLTPEEQEAVRNALATSTTPTNNTEKIDAAIADIDAALGQLKTISGALNNINLDGLNALNSPEFQALVAGTDPAVAGVNNLVASLPQVQALTDGTNSLYNGIAVGSQENPSLQTAVGALAEGSNKLVMGTSKMNASIPELTGGVYNLQKGANKLESKSEELRSGTSQLAGGLGDLNGKVPGLSSGIGQLHANSEKLRTGSSQLSDGLTTLNGKTPELSSGVSQLQDGSNTLDGKSGELKDGTSQLSSGLNQLSGGIPALTGGVNTLFDGTKKLSDGTGELSTKLRTGSKQVEKFNLGNKNADMIAKPDKLSQSKYSEVPNYGHALAPYFMSVSLYVGALVFNFIYPIRKIASRKKATAASWFESKVAVGGLVATAMAFIIGGVMQLIGLHVDNQFEYFTMLLITAYAYMYLVMFLAMAFDNPGRFVAMILLVIQLGSAGGVFPMEIISKFYNVVHPFVPMTYSIYGLRQAISGGLGQHMYTSSFMILFVLAVVCLVALYFAMKHLFKKGMAGYSQLNDNQKLLDDDYNYDAKANKEKYTLW